MRNAVEMPSNEQAVAPSVMVEDGRSSQIGRWTAYSSVDPLTDIETTVANRTFRTGAHTVELEVGCGSDKWITYTATTFDQNGDGAPLDWAFAPNGLEFTVQVRADRDDATRWFTEKRRYSNQFRLSGPTKFLARGMALTMRFAMPNEDATIFVDQGDPVFRQVVRPCLVDDTEPAQPGSTAPAARDDGDRSVDLPQEEPGPVTNDTSNEEPLS